MSLEQQTEAVMQQLAGKLVLVVLTAVLSGIVTWLWKLDDRQYDMMRVYATKQDLQDSQGVIIRQLNSLDAKLESLIQRELNGYKRQ